MRTITRMAALMALVFAFAASAAAQPSNGNGNDSVDYAPTTQTLAGTFPFDRSYTLDITSPSSLNKEGMKAIAAGITANLRINVEDFPEGSNEAAATALVTVDDQFLNFNALAETHQTTVRVHVTNGTIPGDYVFTIQADGPNGIGWGNAAHTLTVTVAEPALSDTTPPAVVIISPKDGDKFTFCSAGTVIPVTITANDAESFVTSVWAKANNAPFAVSFPGASNDVVANGNFTATGIGSYALQAWADSAGGTGTSAVVNVSVNYTMSWLPPLSLGKVINGALAIKFAARDCNGVFVADNRVSVEVWEGTVRRFVATFGEGSDAVRIDDVQGQYIANFNPASGVHTYTVKVLFGGFEQASKIFTTK
ncbi:MAG TPA: hypothetical protein VFT39_20230 [Vicinamibacterales bacterium]|nr:hypothetical protein [Vicinamibacterales bacterium]